MSAALAQTMLPGLTAPALAAAGVAAVSIPIAIHLLTRRRRRPAPWAAMRFLVEAYRRHRNRMRIEQLLLLALRCLVVLLLGLALAGPILRGSAGLADITGQGRTVYLVIDNGPTSAATTDNGQARLDQHKTTAYRLIDDLRPGDRVAVIAAARPAEGLLSPPSIDHATARRVLERLTPSAAAGDLPGALAEVREAIRADADPPGPVDIVLLSDFAAGNATLDDPLPGALAELADRGALLRSAPMPTAPNVQITALTPERRVVLPDRMGDRPVVGWEVRLRRIGENLAAEASAELIIEVPGTAPIARSVRWEPGDSETIVRVQTPLPEVGGAVVAASVRAPEGLDTLAMDNRRVARVEVRRRLTVTLLTRRTLDDESLTPDRWIEAALAPVARRGEWSIDVARQDPATLDSAALRGTDVVFALRPDLLDDEGWATLRNWSARGGLIWVAPPSDDGPSLWASRMANALDLPLAAEIDTYHADPALTLDTDADLPDELARLRADLADLLRPIRIHRLLPVPADGLDGSAIPWLVTHDGRALLLSADLDGGNGRLLLLTSAFDPDWNNLTTKPLFVPLLHESLRSTIDRLAPDWSFVAGDQPTLRGPWMGVSGITDPEGEPIALTRTEDETGVRPALPWRTVGVYETDDGLTAVVNVDADAADTRATDPSALDNWLGAIGPWRELDPADPAAAFAEAGGGFNLGWPLLWAVLALAIGEMFLARRASHASAPAAAASAIPTESRI